MGLLPTGNRLSGELRKKALGIWRKLRKGEISEENNWKLRLPNKLG